jgi:hypothetical protein
LVRLTEFQDEFVKMSSEEIVRKQASDVENLKEMYQQFYQLQLNKVGVFIREQGKSIVQATTGGKYERFSDMTGPMA